MIRTGAITYDGLPISRGGAHRLRTRGFAEGHSAIATFVEAASPGARPTEVLLEVHLGADLAAAQLIAEFDASLPKRRVRRVGALTGHQWEMEGAQLADLAQRFDACALGSSAAIHVTWPLALAPPGVGAGDYLDFQVGDGARLGRSFVYGRISSATTARLFLTLPYVEPGAEARAAAAKIQAHFPARLSSSHWKQWRLNKAGTGYVGRRIAWAAGL